MPKAAWNTPLFKNIWLGSSWLPPFLQDTDMYYELKKFLEDSKASIPSSLLHHEAAKRPPDAEKSKRETTVYARK